MYTHLGSQAEALERTADGRSFFKSKPVTFESSEPFPFAEARLYIVTQNIHRLTEKTGKPSIIVDGLPSIERCSVENDFDPVEDLHLWEIQTEQDGQTSIVHGQVSKESSSWQLLDVDHQGVKRHNTDLKDPKGLLTGFVLRVIERSKVERVAGVLSAEISAAKKKYKEYLAEQPEMSAGDPYTRSQEELSLINGFAGVGFIMSNVTNPRHIVRSNQGRNSPPVVELPISIGAIAAETDFEASVRYNSRRSVT